MLYSVSNAKNFLGACCNDLNILMDSNYNITINDFDNRFHRIIFAVLKELSLKSESREVDGITIALFLEDMPEQHSVFIANKGIEFIDTIKEMTKGYPTKTAYETIKKFSLLRAYKSNGIDVSDIYDDGLILPEQVNAQKEKLAQLTLEDIKQKINLKVLKVNEEFGKGSSNAYSFHGGDNLHELLNKCKEAPLWGRSFSSNYLNTILRGMQGSKYLIRSAGTGGGKSRRAIGDMIGISCKLRYDTLKEDWIENPNPEPTLFITTELVQDEVQLALLSAVSGIPEEDIKNGNWTKYEEKRLRISAEVIADSPIYCEFINDFDTDDIKNMIEKNIAKYGTQYVFFDYLQITPKLAMQMKRIYGNPRDDQMLGNFSSALKNIANDFNIFLATSTQLNRMYKTDAEPDATWLRGGAATADKADYCLITMPVGAKELDKIEPLIKAGHSNWKPNTIHYIFKNRGGKYKGVMVWTCTNLDIMMEKDCFVTNLNYELIPEIKPTILD